jgi:hypothetical protein
LVILRILTAKVLDSFATFRGRVLFEFYTDGGSSVLAPRRFHFELPPGSYQARASEQNYRRRFKLPAIAPQGALGVTARASLDVRSISRVTESPLAGGNFALVCVQAAGRRQLKPRWVYQQFKQRNRSPPWSISWVDLGGMGKGTLVMQQNTSRVRASDNAARSKEEIALDLTKLAYTVKNFHDHDELLDLYAKCLRIVKDVAHETSSPEVATPNGNGAIESDGLVLVDPKNVSDALEVLKQSGINARIG